MPEQSLTDTSNLEGCPGDRVSAISADGSRQRLEGHFELLLADSGDRLSPVVVVEGHPHEVFPATVRVLEELKHPDRSSEATGVTSLRSAADLGLIWGLKVTRHDATWDEMFAWIISMVAPLKVAGWSECEVGQEIGDAVEDDFVYSCLTRNGVVIDIEVGESGWARGWEEIEHDNDDLESDEGEETPYRRRIRDIGRFDDPDGFQLRYRSEGWIP